MRIPLDDLQVLLDTTIRSLSIGGDIWTYSQDQRKTVVNAVLAAMKEKDVQIGNDPPLEPDGPKEIHPKKIAKQVVNSLVLGIGTGSVTKALFYGGDLVGFFDVHANGGKQLVKWERSFIHFPGEGIDTERCDIRQGEADNENEIISMMLREKFGEIKVVEE